MSVLFVSFHDILPVMCYVNVRRVLLTVPRSDVEFVVALSVVMSGCECGEDGGRSETMWC